jgi:hypothetical protein
VPWTHLLLLGSWGSGHHVLQVPLVLALDGDAAVFTFVMAVELGLQIGHNDDGHQHTWHRWRT